MKKRLYRAAICALLILTMIRSQASADVVPRDRVLEEAFLQQLHPIIQSSLNSIYNEKYSQVRCTRVMSIHERITISKHGVETKPVDAIHGAKYFEIRVGLVRKNDEYVELRLKNDTASAQYYLVNYSKGDRPQGFSCS
ncbi:hypothetical protein GC093_17105 [Paenibacillus sp. LMG 31456]|uniref:DUF3888 domain-containing protein n=1 Tax=Paenibacillus foliorum TaxID=2654974 RepID=A0A972K0Q9_9BACL|nr:hypothetical protein [Paenibacillus foliorum]NOU94926.1 hypothetical protein [Paenibacillus foliorum]